MQPGKTGCFECRLWRISGRVFVTKTSNISSRVFSISYLIHLVTFGDLSAPVTLWYEQNCWGCLGVSDFRLYPACPGIDHQHKECYLVVILIIGGTYKYFLIKSDLVFTNPFVLFIHRIPPLCYGHFWYCKSRVFFVGAEKKDNRACHRSPFSSLLDPLAIDFFGIKS